MLRVPLYGYTALRHARRWQNLSSVIGVVGAAHMRNNHFQQLTLTTGVA